MRIAGYPIIHCQTCYLLWMSSATWTIKSNWIVWKYIILNLLQRLQKGWILNSNHISNEFNPFIPYVISQTAQSSFGVCCLGDGMGFWTYCHKWLSFALLWINQTCNAVKYFFCRGYVKCSTLWPLTQNGSQAWP